MVCGTKNILYEVSYLITNSLANKITAKAFVKETVIHVAYN